MTKLKSGDVVQLKSGGPKMTVESVKDDGNAVRCAWFDRNVTGFWNSSSDSFHVDAVKVLEPDSA